MKSLKDFLRDSLGRRRRLSFPPLSFFSPFEKCAVSILTRRTHNAHCVSKVELGGRENLWNFLLFLLLILTSTHLSLSFGRWAEKRGGKKKNFLSYFSPTFRGRHGGGGGGGIVKSRSRRRMRKKKRDFFCLSLSLSLSLCEGQTSKTRREKKEKHSQGGGRDIPSLAPRRRGRTYVHAKKERTKFGSSPSCGRSRRLRPSSSSSSFPSAENLGTSLFSPPAVPGQPFSPNYRSSHTHAFGPTNAFFDRSHIQRRKRIQPAAKKVFFQPLSYLFPPSLSLLPAS